VFTVNNQVKRLIINIFTFVLRHFFCHKIMRAVIQRVKRASVSVKGRQIAKIESGLLILLGIEEADNIEDIEWLSKKIVQLRIFNDKDDIMNLSAQDINGDIIVVSQFTLHAKTKKGNRPSYIKAAGPNLAIPLYNKFIRAMEQLMSKKIGTGEFGAIMDIEMINNGPVTIIIDTKNKE